MPERGLPGGAAVGPHRHRADQIDPDWLYALQHVLPQIDARTYVSEDPASGGAELPFRADINAPVPSPSRERSKRRAEEENLSADVSPIPSPSRARSKCRMEEENPSAEIPWYEANPNIDKDFRVFFQHARMVNGRLVLEKDGQVVRYEQVVESADGAFALGEKEKVAVTSTNGPASESEFPSESHGRGFSAFCQKVEERQDEKVAVDTLNTVNRETNPCNAKAHIASVRIPSPHCWLIEYKEQICVFSSE